MMSCSNRSAGKKPVDSTSKSITTQSKNDSSLNIIDKRSFVDFDTSLLRNENGLKSFIIKNYSSELDAIRKEDITKIGDPITINVKNLGVVKIFPITFSDSLPEVAAKSAFLVADQSVKKAAMLYLDDLTPIKVRVDDEGFYLAGYYKVRSSGYFLVYKFSNGGGRMALKKIFDSYEFGECPNGVPVINSSLDCISYDPFKLRLSNKDVDGDGVLDMVFSGRVNTYCKGLESGRGRQDTRPVKSENVDVIFQTNHVADTLSWKLTDTSICKRLYYNAN